MSEYEIAVQESLQFQRSGQSGEDPLAAYERAFKKLCELPADMLMNNGYSSEEVSLMKAYLSGSVSFDVAAMRASASLSSDLRCTKHTSTQYTCVYSWEWDKIPAGEDTAGYALTMVGINENSQSIETKKVAQRPPAGKTVKLKFLGTGMISVMPVPLLAAHPRECSPQGRTRYVPSACACRWTCPVRPHRPPSQAL